MGHFVYPHTIPTHGTRCRKTSDPFPTCFVYDCLSTGEENGAECHGFKQASTIRPYCWETALAHRLCRGCCVCQPGEMPALRDAERALPCYRQTRSLLIQRRHSKTQSLSVLHLKWLPLCMVLVCSQMCPLVSP